MKPIDVPQYYSDMFNISVHSAGVRVGTRDSQDTLSWLRENVKKVRNEADGFLVVFYAEKANQRLGLFAI